MKNRRTQGFTLIELLIVIAIIGILAAVLIPNLLGARTSANKKAIQSHSSNVYKAVLAVMADNPSLTVATTITASGNTCMTAVQTISGAKYGWNAAPGSAASCTIAANGAGDDFVVTVTGNGDIAGQTSVNGGNVVPAAPAPAPAP